MNIISPAKPFDIDEVPIWRELAEIAPPDPVRVREILAKAREMKGLDAADMVPLMNIQDQQLRAELFETARVVKETIYGRRLVLFAPLYVSNLCGIKRGAIKSWALVAFYL